MKTNEELNAIKNEIDTLNKKLAELNDEELKQVAGGGIEPGIEPTVLESPASPYRRRAPYANE